MDEFTADAFANRDEPIPEVSIKEADDSPKQRAGRSGGRLSARYLKGKLLDAKSDLDDKSESSVGSLSLHDRLLTKYVTQPC